MANPRMDHLSSWRLEITQGYQSSQALLTFTSHLGSTHIWDATGWPISMHNLTQRQVLDELMSALLVFLEHQDG